MKKSIIKKSISRKLSTAAYEAVDVHVEIEETVEWETVAERMKKTQDISKVLTIDFVQTLNKVTSELGINRKIATISSQKAQEKKADKSINNDGDDGSTFDFDRA